MFTIWGNKRGFCDRVQRRDFLRVGAFGASLTLADVLRGRAAAAPAQASRPKSAIMIYLPGGPPHLDMYDLKPEAPREYRGEFSPIATNVPGVQICELFPLQARMWDKLAVLRSCVGTPEHSDSSVMTGKTEVENRIANHPSFGSVVSRVRNSDIPQFITLRPMSRGTEPGFLGVQHRPFEPQGQGIANLRPQPAMNGTRLEDRRAMLENFDSVRRDLDENVNGLDAFTTRAFDMISNNSVRNALDLNREPVAVRDRYRGADNFLTARRLVEAGVGCVTMSSGGWDTHANNFNAMRRNLPILDKGIANLIQDLHDRGMQDEVVLVMWGEFGRTPLVNNEAGRDHWPQVMSALIAGGGLRMGQAIGSTTRRGEAPQNGPYTVQQVLATLYRTMGIDPAMTFDNGAGRPVHLVENRTLVRELV